MTSNTPVTQADRAIPTDIWKKVDELSGYTSQPNTTMEWAQYSDRLRCALAEALLDAHLRHRQSSSNAGEARDEIHDALVRAYHQGANDVHAEWQKHWESGDGYGPPDPDFTESSHDHAASEMPGLGAALASLSIPTAEPPSPCRGDGMAVSYADLLEAHERILTVEMELVRAQRVLAPFAEKATKWEERHSDQRRDSTQVQHRLGDFREARTECNRIDRTLDGMVEKPFAYCCAEGGGATEHCDCVNKNWDTAWVKPTPPTPDRIGKDAVREIEPIAFMRRWAFEGVEGTKGNRPRGWQLHAVTRSKALSDDIPLYPTPPTKDDALRLREALGELWSIVHGCDLRLSVPMETIHKVRAALSATPAQEGEGVD